ncbi:MAG: hypothetical protein HYR79_12235 [Nitrospirae bacterium]|nr:hypothetical protein [Nitrospirota bacterium]
MVKIYIIIALILLLLTGANKLVMGDGFLKAPANIYSNEDYGFSINLPDEWKESRDLSKNQTDQIRHEDKSGLAIVFMASETKDPTELSLLIMFQSRNQSNHFSSEEIEKRLSELVASLAEPPRDQVFESRVLKIDNRSAVQAEVCTTFDNSRKCNLIEHVTEIFLDGSIIRIQFSISKTLFPKYEEKIKQSLSSVHLSPKKSFEIPADCQKTDIQIIDHEWKSKRIPIDDTGKHQDLDLVFIMWEVTLKNKSNKTCLVKVGYKLFDKNGNELYFDNTTSGENIDPNGNKIIKGGYLHDVQSKLLPKIDSSRVELISVK